MAADPDAETKVEGKEEHKQKHSIRFIEKSPCKDTIITINEHGSGFECNLKQSDSDTQGWCLCDKWIKPGTGKHIISFETTSQLTHQIEIGIVYELFDTKSKCIFKYNNHCKVFVCSNQEKRIYNNGDYIWPSKNKGKQQGFWFLDSKINDNNSTNLQLIIDTDFKDKNGSKGQMKLKFDEFGYFGKDINNIFTANYPKCRIGCLVCPPRSTKHRCGIKITKYSIC